MNVPSHLVQGMVPLKGKVLQHEVEQGIRSNPLLAHAMLYHEVAPGNVRMVVDAKIQRTQLPRVTVVNEGLIDCKPLPNQHHCVVSNGELFAAIADKDRAFAADLARQSYGAAIK